MSGRNLCHTNQGDQRRQRPNWLFCMTAWWRSNSAHRVNAEATQDIGSGYVDRDLSENISGAKDKNARARQRARKPGDILTPTPPERVKQFGQPKQLCSRCHCPRSPNQFRSSQQESPAATATTCQECRRTMNRVRDNPLQTPVRNNSCSDVCL